LQGELRARDAEIAAARQRESDAAAAKLKEAGDYKALAEKLEADNRSLAAQHQQVLERTVVNSSIEKRLVALGMDPLLAEDVAPLIPRDAIRVDSIGRVTGVEAAIEQHKQSRPRLYQAVAQPAPAATPAPAPATTPAAFAAAMFPTTTTGTAPSGADPARSTDGRVDVMSQTPQQYAVFKRGILRNLRGGGASRLRSVGRRTV
jgi:septal ring-binding cell division protein DamX